MLIEFTVGNYRSFKDPVTLSMVAANLKAKDKSLDENNVCAISDKLSLLTSAAVYGANASGKSNLVAAMRFMRHFVLTSSKDTQSTEPIPVEKFRLSTDTADKPSHFEMVFMVEGHRYRYGFEISGGSVVSEWLFDVPHKRESRLFERDIDNFSLSQRFKEGRGLPVKTRKNALFLSVVAQFNGTVAQQILPWFERLGVLSGLEDMFLHGLTLQYCEDQEQRQAVTDFVRKMDLGIDDVQVTKVPLTQESIPLGLPGEIVSALVALQEAAKKAGGGAEQVVVRTVHTVRDSVGAAIGQDVFQLDKNESAGTQKLFALAGPLMAILQAGGVLVVDELDARLHPIITRAIVGLFSSKKTNPKHAQMIFTTQDTNLLNNRMFRRDQIWFTEKDSYGATHLYSLAEFKVRNDASFESDYIKGKYGAVPFVGDLQNLVGEPDAG